MANIGKCKFCGTSNVAICCKEAEDYFRTELYVFLLNGFPSDEQLNVITAACARVAETDPSFMETVTQHVLRDREKAQS